MRAAIALALIATTAAAPGCKRKREAPAAEKAAEAPPPPQRAVPKPERPRGDVADLEADDSEVRLRAVRAFAKNPPADPAAIKAMVGLLSSERAEVRLSAATALTYVTDAPYTTEPLEEALADPDPLVSFQALKALARRGEPSAVAGVVKTLSDPDRARRAWAAGALGKLGDPARGHWKTLLPLLSDPVGSVRLQAIRAIGKLGDESAIDPLLALAAEHRGMIRAQVKRAIEDLDIAPEPKAKALARIDAK